MIGLRGIPNIQGGIETHVEHLSQELVKLGCQVEVLARSPYVETGAGSHSEWRGVRITRVWAPRSSKFEAIVHTFLGVWIAAWRRPALLHIHAIGPALMAPLARILGLRVIVTHHGFDYLRQKWGRRSRLVLRLGEYCGMRFANGRIAVSRATSKSIEERFSLPCRTIHNGINLPAPVRGTDTLERFAIEPFRYVLNVSRLVPEKRHLDLIAAFAKAKLRGWKLVLVGGDDHNSAYAEQVREAVRLHANIVMTGKLLGNELGEVYAHAGVFVLPSSHEGFPIVLLEAMSYGLPTLASDIPGNLEVGMPINHYFRTGDVESLAELLRDFSSIKISERERASISERVAQRFAWPEIGRLTLQVYRECLGNVEPPVGEPVVEIPTAG